MEKERQNFVYGNLEEGVEGCIARGIPEKVAQHIYDEMTDFAKYAFNKSHAAAYAVISYQTAFLKTYYPVEFMAALLTSVIDNINKVIEYVSSCRQMGIEILPPDINVGEITFTQKDGKIRYALSAIKGMGRPVIKTIVEEREKNGSYQDLTDFISRVGSKEINKRILENLIKAGAMDSLPGSRREKIAASAPIHEHIMQQKKIALTGQLSLFEFLEPSDRPVFTYEVQDLAEYNKDELLVFEKELLGIYISGHPLQLYEGLLNKNTTAKTMDFLWEEEQESSRLSDGEVVIIGGMITGKKRKITRRNENMAFLTIEDLYGTIEVIVFPRDYEKYRSLLDLDRKILVRGRVGVEEEKDAKLICQEIIPFEAVPRELWIKFFDQETYKKSEKKLFSLLQDFDGKDKVVIYCEKEKALKTLPPSYSIEIKEELLFSLYEVFGRDNVRIVEKSIEKR